MMLFLAILLLIPGMIAGGALVLAFQWLIREGEKAQKANKVEETKLDA